jgi:DNA-binding IclR family transcriptional regulator
MSTSPPTRRVVQVIEHLAALGDHEATLSEISRALGLAPPTCLNVLNELVEAQWVTRRAHGRSKTYALGPQLATIAASAHHTRDPAALARRAAAQLAARLQLPCTVTVVGDAEMTIIDRFGPPGPFDTVTRVGEVIPIEPPLARAAVIWKRDPAPKAWIEGLPASEHTDRERFERVVDASRRSGFNISGFSEREVHLHGLLAELSSRPGSEKLVEQFRAVASEWRQRDLLPDEIDPSGRYSVGYAIAPVFDHDGEPVVLLIAYLAHHDVPYRRVQHVVSALTAEARTITKAIGGYSPWGEAKRPAGH